MYKKKCIIEFLNVAINDDYVFDFSKIKLIKWENVFEEAKKHNILALIYYAILKLKLKNNIDFDLLDKWKKYVFLSSTRELCNINRVEGVFREFNQNSLKAIALKGTIIRDLYPKPELRTMSDCDIIVSTDELERSGEMLKLLGYEEHEREDEHGAHKVFKKSREIIELHWTLINEEFFKGSKEFESHIWENIRKVKIGDEEALALNHEYMIIHLISHMAVHLVWSGFGLRQVADLYLYSKVYEKEIDWEKVTNIIEKSGLLNFTIVLYKVIEILFKYKIENDKKTFNATSFNDAIAFKLIDYIFDSGVFGKEDKSNIFAKTIMFSGEKVEGSNVNKFIRLIFPRVNDMNEKYAYAKKYKVLTGIAWIHHLINGIFHKDFSIDEKFDFLFNTVSTINNKKDMLKKLNLDI